MYGVHFFTFDLKSNIAHTFQKWKSEKLPNTDADVKFYR